MDNVVEICCSLERGAGINGDIGSGETSFDRVGDIISARRSPFVDGEGNSLWGSAQKEKFLITYLQSADIYNSIGSDDGVAIYPYGIRAPDEMVTVFGFTFPIPSAKILNKSKYRVDIDMFTGSAGLDPEDVTSEPVKPNGKDFLVISDLIFDDSDRTI